MSKLEEQYVALLRTRTKYSDEEIEKLKEEVRNAPVMVIPGETKVRTKHVTRSISKFKDLIDSQEEKGMEKYGQPLNPTDMKYDWLEMAAEEMVDGFQYLVAEQKKRKFVVEKIRSLADSMAEGSTIEAEINHWLDVLEGK